MTFIELTEVNENSTGDNKVIFNLDHIIMIFPCEMEVSGNALRRKEKIKITRIITTRMRAYGYKGGGSDNMSYAVKESMDEILRKVNK